MKKREEEKIRNLISSLIDIQLNKLENKLSYLEEYEKLVLNERNQLDLYQKYCIAEVVNIAYKKNELAKQTKSKKADAQQGAERKNSLTANQSQLGAPGRTDDSINFLQQQLMKNAPTEEQTA